MRNESILANNRPRGVGTKDQAQTKHVSQQTKHNNPDPSVTTGTDPLGVCVPRVFRQFGADPAEKNPKHVCDARCLLSPEQVLELEAERHRQLAELAAWREQA
jgi:hypothetical protein